jgi:hypothetical protein
VNRLFCGLRLGLCGLLAVLVYVCAHEGGHVLAALATGRSVVDVTLLSLTPRISLAGSSTAAQDAFAAAAGSGLVVLIATAWALVSRRVTFGSQAAGFFAGIELLAWFVSAAVHSFAAPGNDVTKFIVFSGLGSGWVVLAVGCVGGVFAFLRFSPVRRVSLPRPARASLPLSV